MLVVHPTRFNPNGTAFTIVCDLDIIAELEKEDDLLYDHEEPAALHLLHNYVGAIGPNAFEIANDICELEVLSPHICTPYDIVRKTKTAKRNGTCFHSFYFDLGMEYMEGLFNVVPAEIDLLSLQEVYDVLENRAEIMNLVFEWEFLLSCDPIYYEWYELPEDSDVWQRLYEDKKKSVLLLPMCVK